MLACTDELWGKCHSNEGEMSKFIRRAVNDKQTDMVERLSFSRQKKFSRRLVGAGSDFVAKSKFQHPKTPSLPSF